MEEGDVTRVLDQLTAERARFFQNPQLISQQFAALQQAMLARNNPQLLLEALQGLEPHPPLPPWEGGRLQSLSTIIDRLERTMTTPEQDREADLAAIGGQLSDMSMEFFRWSRANTADILQRHDLGGSDRELSCLAVWAVQLCRNLQGRSLAAAAAVYACAASVPEESLRVFHGTYFPDVYAWQLASIESRDAELKNQHREGGGLGRFARSAMKFTLMLSAGSGPPNTSAGSGEIGRRLRDIDEQFKEKPRTGRLNVQRYVNDPRVDALRRERNGLLDSVRTDSATRAATFTQQAKAAGEL